MRKKKSAPKKDRSQLLTKTHKFRIYPNKKQIETIESWGFYSRKLYNMALEQRIKLWETFERHMFIHNSVDDIQFRTMLALMREEYVRFEFNTADPKLKDLTKHPYKELLDQYEDRFRTFLESETESIPNRSIRSKHRSERRKQFCKENPLIIPYGTSDVFQSRQFTQFKITHPEFYTLPSTVGWSTLQSLDQAWAAHIKNVMGIGNKPKSEGRTKGVNYPKYRSFRDDLGFIYNGGADISLRLNKVSEKYSFLSGFPKMPNLKVRLHTEIEGKTNTLTLKREKDRYYICVSSDAPLVVRPTPNQYVGIDQGIKIKLQISNGEQKIWPSERLNVLYKRKKFLQRALKRMKKGSKNIRKAYNRVAKIDLKMANIRKYHNKMFATEIVRENSVVCIEALKNKNMTKSAKGTIENPGRNVKAKSGLNRSWLNMAPYAFVMALETKSKEYGTKIIKVNPAYTSQRCPECGHVHRDNRKSQSHFDCVECGFTSNADLVGSRNILALGIGEIDKISRK